MNNNQTEMSQDTKTLIVVLLLIFFYPVGLILMWVWVKWKVWVKILLTLPVLLLIIIFVAAIALVAINPKEAITAARCSQSCTEIYPEENQACLTSCTDRDSFGMKEAGGLSHYLKSQKSFDEAVRLASLPEGEQDPDKIMALIDESISEIEAAVVSQPDSVDALISKGNIYYSMVGYISGAEIQALSAYEKTLEYLPENSELIPLVEQRIVELKQ